MPFSLTGMMYYYFFFIATGFKSNQQVKNYIKIFELKIVIKFIFNNLAVLAFSSSKPNVAVEIKLAI